MPSPDMSKKSLCYDEQHRWEDKDIDLSLQLDRKFPQYFQNLRLCRSISLTVPDMK